MYMKMWLCLRVTFQVAVYEGRREMSITHLFHIPCKSIQDFLFSISDITSCMASRLPSIHSWFFTAHFPHSVQLNSLQVRDSAWPPAPLGWAIICKLCLQTSDEEANADLGLSSLLSADFWCEGL